MRQSFLLLGFCLSLFLLSSQAADSPPNILVMMADDMGIGDTSAYQDWTGNSDEVQVRTPNMEALANSGIRFTDAHSPSSRCTATRYGLLTGRYCWRTRLKSSVLWGPQGDPLIEPDRPTIATLLKGQGYQTGMSGKWHVGLTYRNAAGEPAESWETTDLRQGIADGPLNHGFDYFHGTSRSHPTSADQGWLSQDEVPAATAPLEVRREEYVLNETGVKNYELAMRFLAYHVEDPATATKPFLLYYAAHSNHLSHDPCDELAGIPVKGASFPGGKRSDFIYENDVALGLLLKFLRETDDPRNPGKPMIENTLVIFTSDNGAENKAKTATGPLRSNKGSVFEGGHRVPFMASWPAGGVGDGNPETPGQTSAFPITLVDLFATFAEINGVEVQEGAEDSFSILSALKGNPPASRPPLTHNDHQEGVGKNAAKNPKAAWLAIRMDDPVVSGKVFPGQWKLFMDSGLLLEGHGEAKQLYNLADDLKETTNRLDDPELQPLVQFLKAELRYIHDRGGVTRPQGL